MLIERPGATLRYHAFGAGPLLGYSHGLYFSPAVEDSIGVLDWSGLARSRRILRYDQRGHGASTGAPNEADYAWPALADDLLAVADRAAGTNPVAQPAGTDPVAQPAGTDPVAQPAGTNPVAQPAGTDPVDWAGSSLGAACLLWAAVKRPERFRRLVLMIPPTVRAGRTAAALSYRSAAEAVEARGKAFWLRALRCFPPPPIFAGVPTWVFDADVPEPLLPSVLRGAASSDLPSDADLAGVTMPVLILAWETDPVHPVATARMLAEVLPDARLHVSGTVADVRKWPLLIKDFLA